MYDAFINNNNDSGTRRTLQEFLHLFYPEATSITDTEALQLFKNAVERIKKPSASTPSRVEDNKLILNIRAGMVILEHDEILFIQGEGSYCTFHCERGNKYLVSKNLSYYEDLLAAKHFYRIHQSDLVNLKYVRQITTLSGCSVVLKTAEQLPVARRRKEGLLALLR